MIHIIIVSTILSITSSILSIVSSVLFVKKVVKKKKPERKSNYERINQKYGGFNI